MKTTVVVASLICLLAPLIYFNSVFVGIITSNSVYGQGGTYIIPSIAKVMAGEANSTKSFCHQGDPLIIGGFSIEGFKSPQSLSHTFVYTNQPVKELISNIPSKTNASNHHSIGASNASNIAASSHPSTGASSASNRSAATVVQRDTVPIIEREGWKVGLENNSSQLLIINSTALCLNLHH